MFLCTNEERSFIATILFDLQDTDKYIIQSHYHFSKQNQKQNTISVIPQSLDNAMGTKKITIFVVTAFMEAKPLCHHVV